MTITIAIPHRHPNLSKPTPSSAVPPPAPASWPIPGHPTSVDVNPSLGASPRRGSPQT
ncbi:hypothetical protein BJ508DRAFT_412917 [Ascobolus immersus RN42]|uniref:Uncharacterized protein n=1 Tax=Ascobolus immersus RN42 TaxID=1160509 RepID=A0A3N4IJ87_ASCIM|nr:hypothetical protein BJ508DRAFT_412917 [Ascobolus immersus RN42]